LLRNAGELDVLFGWLVCGVVDDQWGVCFVDEDRVDFVYDREVVFALDEFFAVLCYVVV